MNWQYFTEDLLQIKKMKLVKGEWVVSFKTFLPLSRDAVKRSIRD